MAHINTVVQSVKFYEFVKNSLWLSIIHNKQWNKFSLDITRQFSYIKYGETKRALPAPIKFNRRKSARRPTYTRLSISQEA